MNDLNSERNESYQNKKVRARCRRNSVRIEEKNDEGERASTTWLIEEKK